jgi:predicted Kef-type K+ transport protein
MTYFGFCVAFGDLSEFFFFLFFLCIGQLFEPMGQLFSRSVVSITINVIMHLKQSMMKVNVTPQKSYPGIYENSPKRFQLRCP